MYHIQITYMPHVYNIILCVYIYIERERDVNIYIYIYIKIDDSERAGETNTLR